MKDNDARNMDLTSRKAGEGSGEDERFADDARRGFGRYARR